MAELLTIGEPLTLFASTEDGIALADAEHFKKYLAGAEVNVAVGCVRLRHSVTYLTQLGADPLGSFALREMNGAGIDTQYINQTSEYPTGVEFKARNSAGDPDIYYIRKNSAASHFTSDLIPDSVLSDVKIAHLTGIFSALSDQSLATVKYLIKKLQALHIPISFDPNLRPALWNNRQYMIETLNKLAAASTIVMPGSNEGLSLVGSEDPKMISKFYFDQSQLTQVVIVKMGPSGAFVQTRKDGGTFVPGFRVDQVVDTVGAGDGFAVGVLTGLLDGLSLETAVKRGTAIGALAVQTPGDHDGYPTVHELDQFMNQEDGQHHPFEEK